MNSAFDPKTGTWEIGWPGRVAKHDVVYLSPPEDPMQGMPIGNADVGGSSLSFADRVCVGSGRRLISSFSWRRALFSQRILAGSWASLQQPGHSWLPPTL